MAVQIGEKEQVAKQDIAAELSSQVEAARKAVRQVAKDAAIQHAARVQHARKATKSERTREKILQAAADLIVERGNTDFQMSEVAERCNMSKGALYYYFRDRDGVVEEIFTRVIDDFASRQERAVAKSRSAEEAIKGLIHIFCETVRDGGLFVSAISSGMLRGGMAMTPEVYTRFNRIANLVTVQIERAQREGVVRSDVDPDISAVTLCGGILSGAARQIYKHPERIDAEDMTEELYQIIINGIGTPASRAKSVGE